MTVGAAAADGEDFVGFGVASARREEAVSDDGGDEFYLME